MPPFVPFGNHAAYDALTPRAVALVEPVAHAPWFGAAPAVAAAILAAAVLAVLWVAARRAGATAAASRRRGRGRDQPAGLPPAARRSAPSRWSAWASAGRVRSSSPPASRRRARPPGARLLTALAVAVWPPLVVVTPMVAAALAGARARLGRGARRRDGRRDRRSRPVGGAGRRPRAGAGQRGRCRVVRDRGRPQGHRSVRVAAAGLRWRCRRCWPSSARSCRCGTLSTGRRVALAVAALVPFVADWAAPIWRDEIRRAVLWSAWPLAGAGIGWLAALAPRDRAAWVPVAIGFAAGGERPFGLDPPGRGRRAAGVRDRARRRAGADRCRRAGDDRRRGHPRRHGAGGLGRRIGPAARAAPASMASTPPSPAAARCWPGRRARYQLELWGFRLATRAGVTAPAPFSVAAVTGRLQCLPVASPWRELPGLEYSGRLGLHVPAGPGRLEVVILSPPPLSPRMATMDGQPTGRMSPLAMDLPSLPPVLWPGDGQLPDGCAERGAHRVAGADRHGAVGRACPRAGGHRRWRCATSTTRDRATWPPCVPRRCPVTPSRVTPPWPLDDNAYFAGGWHVAERDASGPFRWTAGRAVTLVPAASSAAVTVVVTARPAVGAARPVTLSIDRERLDRRRARDERRPGRVSLDRARQRLGRGHQRDRLRRLGDRTAL